MPAPFVKTKKDEKYWNWAKKRAEKSKGKSEEEFSDRDWGLVAMLYKRKKQSEMGSLNTTGDFDQYGISGLGQNWSGDFDQYSIHGVDFGEDYTKNYGIKPNNLEGVSTMYGHYAQMGEAYEMGVVPENVMGEADYGLVPEGLGQYSQQTGGMGYAYSQLGNQYTQMGNPIVPKGLGQLQAVTDHLKASMVPGVPNWALYAGGGFLLWAVLQKSQGRKVFGF